MCFLLFWYYQYIPIDSIPLTHQIFKNQYIFWQYDGNWHTKKIKKEQQKALEKRLHKKNWIVADRLFSAIAGELQTESIDARHMKEKLIVEAIIDMDFPLSMKSGTKHDAAEVITAAKELDCPEYMLFQLYAGGNCDLKKVALVLEFIALELV